ncbi:terminase small subunit [Halomonas elongata]|uniref:Terminase small subunit n=1 Tax=Halomonas elongata (strain ATCC 33173 / DSM 2581 / NBRC 15536 / NCIMB 2198 / 1H9) TaxID=768066 RepID=E1VAD2_HALED|nr:terminase small subunit [Halomonas elongata]WBF19223.1 terminase small subunit [Halomonas elongata]WPU48083.1 terminase small subunit [Halomonas elongata DSM 2581]CBV41978.1 phage terminase small subunit [Halomonas elongata DSM 2581]
MTKAAQEAVALTARQSRFVDEYLKDLNGKQAAIRAGYAERSAEGTASRLLSNAKVAEAIAQRKALRSERTKIDADYVLHRLVEIDQMDVADILADDGSILPVREWPQSWRRTLSGLDVAELWDGQGDEREQIGLLKKIKWPDKVKNLELLGKHVDVQAWRERHEHTGKNGGPIETVGISTDDPEEAARIYRDMMGD